MLKLSRSVGVALSLVAGSLAVSAQRPPPLLLLVVEISPRAAVHAGGEWFWSPIVDAAKVHGPFQSGDIRVVDTNRIRVTPRQLPGPCVAPAAVDIEIKPDQAGYVALAYSGDGCV